MTAVCSIFIHLQMYWLIRVLYYYKEQEVENHYWTNHCDCSVSSPLNVAFPPFVEKG